MLLPYPTDKSHIKYDWGVKVNCLTPVTLSIAERSICQIVIFGHTVYLLFSPLCTDLIFYHTPKAQKLRFTSVQPVFLLVGRT